MSQNPDLARHSDYFAARAAEERRMAMAAADSNVRAVHLEMAQRYDEAAKGDRKFRPTLVVGEQRDVG